MKTVDAHNLRVTRGMVDSKVGKELQAAAKKFMVKESGFVIDLYMLLKTNGTALIGRSTLKKIIADLKKSGMKFTEAYRFANKQFSVMYRIKKLPYFDKLCAARDLIDSVERLLAIFQSLSNKLQPAKCTACHLMPQCAFGSQFNYTTSFTADTVNRNLIVHDDCPHPPIANIQSQASNVITLLFIMADPISGAGMAGALGQTNPNVALQLSTVGVLFCDSNGGKSSDFDATFTANDVLTGIEKFVTEITSKQLAIFELARTFTETLLPGEHDNKIRTDEPARDVESRNLLHTSEVTRALPSEMAMDDDAFDRKIATKELAVRQDITKQKKKQFFYMLIDISISMQAALLPNKYALIHKSSLASALALSVMKKVMEEKSKLFLRFFCGQVDRLRVAQDVNEFADTARMIGLSSYNGGGTDIMRSLTTAYWDIKGGGEFSKAEILLITDGEDSRICEDDVENRYVGLKTITKNVVLHVLDISPGNQRTKAQELLKQYAKHYSRIDPNTIDFAKVANQACDK